MGRIQFSANSHDIRFYIKSDANSGSFHDSNYLFNRLDENPEQLDLLNNRFYLAIPIVSHEISIGSVKTWVPNFLGNNTNVSYHIMMKYSTWNSFIYQLKTPAPTSSESELIVKDTNPDSPYYDCLFLLIKLIGVCGGSLRDLIEYQFSVYATYQDETDGIIYSTLEVDKDDFYDNTTAVSNFVAVNNPTAPYIYDCPVSSGVLKPKIMLSRSVTFSDPVSSGGAVYEILCFTDKITPTEQNIRNETRELMGDIETFTVLDKSISEYEEYIILNEGAPAATVTKYIDKAVLRSKGVKSVYLGVRLKNDNYGNHTEPNYNTIVTMDWFRVDIETKEDAEISIDSFSCNFMTLIDSDTVPNRNAIKAGSENLLQINVTGSFPSRTKFYLDLGLFSKKIQIPYDPATGFSGVNLIEYDKYFVPKISIDEYEITYDEITNVDRAYGKRERAFLFAVCDDIVRGYDVENFVYSGIDSQTEIYRFARTITSIYDYDVLKDRSLYMNTDERPECIMFYVEEYAGPSSSGYGRIMIKNPFYYYYQEPRALETGEKGNSPYVEYVNNNAIIRNEEYYAKIIRDCTVDIKHDDVTVISGGTLQCNDNSSSTLYGGFLITSNQLSYALGENNFKITISHKGNVLVQDIPFLYVGTQLTEDQEKYGEFFAKDSPLSIKPGFGILVNGNYARADELLREYGASANIVNMPSFEVSGDLIVNGGIYKYNGETVYANGITVELPWPGQAWYYNDVGSEIVYIDSDIHDVSLIPELLEDIRTTGNHGENNIYVRDCKIYIEEATAASPDAGGQVTCVMIDLVYTDPQSILWRYVGRYKDDTGNALERYPLLNVKMSAVPRG